MLLNGSSLDDCGRLDDCLDKTGRILVFFLLKSRISHHEHSFLSLQPPAAHRTDAKQTNKNGNLSETCLNCIIGLKIVQLLQKMKTSLILSLPL